MAAGISSVSPSSADPGDVLTVTMTLASDAVPPIPPVGSPSGQPIEMSIGSIALTSFSRSAVCARGAFQSQ